jgi:DNA polymerase (family 10)
LSKRIDIAGSIRRKVDDPVDIDIVMVPRDKQKVRERLAHLGEITEQGSTMVETKIKGVDVDTYFAEPESYGAQLMTRTGPWQGNLGNRTLAKNRGMKLSQYGLFDRKTNKRIAGKTEKEIYEALGKKYKEPEIRGM